MADSEKLSYRCLHHRRNTAPCRAGPLRDAPLALSKPHGRGRLLSLRIARPTLPPLPDPTHSSRPGHSQERERDRESKPHADCLLEPGSPLRSLCSLHASAAAMTAAAALPLLKLLLLLHTVHSLLPIHRYRRPQSARPFIDQRSRLPLRCDRRTRPAGGGPPFLPS